MTNPGHSGSAHPAMRGDDDVHGRPPGGHRRGAVRASVENQHHPDRDRHVEDPEMLDRRSQRQQAPVQTAFLVACRYHHHQTRRDVAHTSSTDAISGSGAICTQEFIDRRNPAGPVSLAAAGPSAIDRPGAGPSRPC